MTHTKKGPYLSPSDKNSIAQFLIANGKDGVVNRGKVDEAAASFGVCRRTIQYTWKAARKQMLEGPVSFKPKTGTLNRLPLQLDEERMKAIPFSKRSTIRRLAKELEVSKSTVGRWIKLKMIKAHTNAIKPTITDANKLQRLNYNLRALHLDRESNKIKYETMHNVIHIDEKWFYLQRTTERSYKLDEEDDPYRTCKSKRFIPKVMFMCAVARPQYSEQGEVLFDGKIGVFPFIKTEPAQRNSRNRIRGTMVTKSIDSITKDVIKDCVLNQIVPAIKEKWPEGASKHIIIQQDNAKPHIKNNDPEFRAVASSDGFNIQLICQPPNSPDTNVLDLGYFSSIQALQVDTPSLTVEELVTNVLTSFEELEVYKLNSVFLSLQASMIEVMKLKGHNDYKTPHMGKEALRRTNSLPLSLEVDEDVVRAGIEHLIAHGYHGGAYDIGSLISDLGYA